MRDRERQRGIGREKEKEKYLGRVAITPIQPAAGTSNSATESNESDVFLFLTLVPKVYILRRTAMPHKYERWDICTTNLELEELLLLLPQ